MAALLLLVLLDGGDTESSLEVVKTTLFAASFRGDGDLISLFSLSFESELGVDEFGGEA